MYQVQEPLKRLNISKLILIESREYKDPYIKPYELHVDYEELDKISEVVNKATKLSNPGLIDSMNTNILRLSDIPIRNAEIVGGWREKRFRFVLIFESIEPSTGSAMVNYIQGYTNFLGATRSGAIADDMVFIPNSVIVLVKRYDQISGNYVVFPVGQYNITVDETYSYTSSGLVLARPFDIISRSMVHKMDQTIRLVTNEGRVDRSIVNVNEILPDDHVKETIKSIINARLESEPFVDDPTILGKTAGTLGGKVIESIDFFKELLRITNDEVRSVQFTKAELTRLDPNVDNKTTIIFRDAGMDFASVKLPTILTAEDTEELYTPTVENNIAYLIHDAMIYVLTHTLINRLVFTMTNMTPDGQPQHGVLYANSYMEGIDIPQQAERAIIMFKNKIWNTITQNNMLGVSILVDSFLEGDTTISISINNKPEVVYRFPTFSSSKFLPVINDINGVNNLTNTYTGIIDTVLESSSNAIEDSFRLVESTYKLPY